MELYELFAEFGDTGSVGVSDGDAILPGGRTLTAANAATCLLDPHRTAAFVRGLWAAIREARRAFPGQSIEVVYAGTGPFASLATPLMPLLNSRHVRFSLLEMNARSVVLLRGLVEKLGLTRYIAEIRECDATAYRHPSPIHVAVTETMQRSLGKEPFVAIVHNLRRQLAPNGFLVPERVSVSVAAIDAEGEQARWNGAADAETHHELARLLEITRSGDHPHFVDSESTPVRVTFPALDRRESWVGLITEIATFGEHHLRRYESGLTTPEILWPLSPMGANETVEFRYCISEEPGFRWRRGATLVESDVVAATPRSRRSS